MIELKIHNKYKIYIEFPDNCQGILDNQDQFYRWIKNFRSGGFKQLHGQLATIESDEYCSLGLLFKKQIKKLSNDNVNVSDINVIYSYLDEWCNIFNEITVYIDDAKFTIIEFIFELNDFAKLNFEQISYILEYIHRIIKDEEVRKLETQITNRQWMIGE